MADSECATLLLLAGSLGFLSLKGAVIFINCKLLISTLVPLYCDHISILSPSMYSW